MENSKFYTAICFDFNNKPYKYRNIKASARTMASFEKFCSSKDILYINYYDKATKLFIEQKFRQPGGVFVTRSKK